MKMFYFNKRILWIFPLLALALMCFFYQRSAREAAERPDESFVETNAGLITPQAPTPTQTDTPQVKAFTQTAKPSPTRTVTRTSPSAALLPSATLTLTAQSSPTEAATATQTATKAPVSAGEVIITRDIQYLVVEGIPVHLTSLDIYTPAAGEGLPVMVYIHGESWRDGDKGDTGSLAEVFTHSGYVFVSTNYRLYPTTNYRTQAQNVASAIAWVHENIAAYGGNPERIYLIGYSAGAHLAALVATNVGYMIEAGLDTKVIQGVVVLDTPALNLPLLAWDGTLPDEYAQIFGTEEQGWINASPIDYIVSGRYVPPMAVVYSATDPGIPCFLIASSFIKRLDEVGILAVGISAETQSHEQLMLDFGKPGDALTLAVFDFLVEIGAPGF